MKNWYNGYKIGKEIIFNPWSIMHCLYSFYTKDNNPIREYWIRTGNTVRLE